MDGAIDNAEALIARMGTDARAAAAELAFASAEQKQAALMAAADAVQAHQDQILTANAQDLAYAAEKGLSPAMVDRLTLTPKGLDGIIASLRALQAQGRTLLIASHDPNLIAAMDREVRL